MKVWKYYKIPSEEALNASEDLDITDKYPLYAFTSSKTERDVFRLTRKGNLFMEIMTRMTKEEYVEWANNHSNQMLREYQYTDYIDTKDETTKENHGLMSVERLVLTTWNEKDYVESAVDQMFEFTNNPNDIFSVNPFIMTDEIIKALSKLSYLQLWKLYTPLKISDEIEEKLDELDSDDYSSPPTEYNEFAIYITLFGDTFANKIKDSLYTKIKKEKMKDA